MDNTTIARQLQNRARQLSAQGGNLFRVRAYRRAALEILRLDRPAAELAASGRLQDVPGIGRSLESTIAELAGDWQPLPGIAAGMAQVN